MEPAKKRRVDSGKTGSGGVHPTAAASSTGGSGQHSIAMAGSAAGSSKHSTATTSLLFIDYGNVDGELQHHLIASARHSPAIDEMEQIKELIDELEPDIVVNPQIIKTKNTTWQLVANGWHEMSRKYIPLQNVDETLYTAYDGCLTTLRRFTPCSCDLKLFFVKIPKCKNSSVRYHVNQINREDIAHSMFALLAKEEAPCLVIGNCGFALASCLTFLLQYEQKTGCQRSEYSIHRAAKMVQAHFVAISQGNRSSGEVQV